MAAPRPAKCYRHYAKHAYTRTAKRVIKKAFIRGVPNIMISHFDMGKIAGDYKFMVNLVAKNNVQIRHTALDATRIVINRGLETALGPNNYFFQIRAYPHHVLRENALISGAGADRLQTGMRASFGRPIGKAARVKRNHSFMTVKVKTKEEADKARIAMHAAFAKLPSTYYITVEELESSPTKS